VKNDKDLSLRLYIVDMRLAYKAAQRENHPLPAMDDLMAMLVDCKYFSKLDIKNAFH
jgi:hypothetical protein